MAKRMLIDATNPDETRVVVVSGNRLEELDFEVAGRRPIKANIYLAKVIRVEPSLQAAFVEFGGNRHGFLAFSEIHPDYYRIPVADRLALDAEEARLADRRSGDLKRDDEGAGGRAPIDDDGGEPPFGEVENGLSDDQPLSYGGSIDQDGSGAEGEESDEPDGPDGPEELPASVRVALRSGTTARRSALPEGPTSEEIEADPDAAFLVRDDDPAREADEPVAEPVRAIAADDAGTDPTAFAPATEHDASSDTGDPVTDQWTVDAGTVDAGTVDAGITGPAMEVLDAPQGSAAEGDAGAVIPPLVDEMPASIDHEPVVALDEQGERPESDAAESDAVVSDAVVSDAATGEPVAYDDRAHDRSPDDGGDTDDTDATGDDEEMVSVRHRGAERRYAETGNGEAENGNGELGAESFDQIGGDVVEDVEDRRPRMLRQYKIQEVIKRRQILLVQVTKEGRGTKGAALTTFLSLPGRFCVLMPNTPRGGGVSRKITNAQDRKRLKDLLDSLDVPDGMSVILRTAGLERSKAEIQRDLEYLKTLWDSIREKTLQSTAPALIYEEGSLIKRAIRDMYTSDVDDIIVEGEVGHRIARDFMRMLMPSHVDRVKLHQDDTASLFVQHRVEQQIDAMHNPVVQLKSGGYVVINQTEALVAIDVNSGRATRERNIEETATKTNLEAADEIARQLRLRDLAGLIVIDFIDMEESRNNAAVERRLKEAMKADRARIQIGRISPFGLLELSRQRLRPSLMETHFLRCPHCQGLGLVRTPHSAAMEVLRAVQEEAARRRSSEIAVTVPVDVALQMFNSLRPAIAEIERKFGVRLLVATDPMLVPPAFRLERIKTRPVEEVTAISQDRVIAEAEREAALIEPDQRPALPKPAADAEPDGADDEDEAGEGPDQGSADGGAAARDEAQRRKRRRRRRRRRPGEGEEGRPETYAVLGAEDRTPEPVDAEDADGDEDQSDADGADTGVSVDPAANGASPASDQNDRRRRRRGRRGGRRRGVEGDVPLRSDADAGPEPSEGLTGLVSGLGLTAATGDAQADDGSDAGAADSAADGFGREAPVPTAVPGAIRPLEPLQGPVEEVAAEDLLDLSDLGLPMPDVADTASDGAGASVEPPTTMGTEPPRAETEEAPARSLAPADQPVEVIAAILPDDADGASTGAKPTRRRPPRRRKADVGSEGGAESGATDAEAVSVGTPPAATGPDADVPAADVTLAASADLSAPLDVQAPVEKPKRAPRRRKAAEPAGSDVVESATATTGTTASVPPAPDALASETPASETPATEPQAAVAVAADPSVAQPPVAEPDRAEPLADKAGEASEAKSEDGREAGSTAATEEPQQPRRRGWWSRLVS